MAMKTERQKDRQTDHRSFVVCILYAGCIATTQSTAHRTISVRYSDDDESTIISIWQRIAIDMLNRRLNIYEQNADEEWQSMQSGNGSRGEGGVQG